MEKYKNSALPINERVADLVSKMTLEQKLAQLQCSMLMGNPADILQGFPNGLGEATAMSGAQTVEENAAFAKAVQDVATHANEISIPILLHAEAITGVNTIGGTIFPSAIALGATWNPEIVEKMTDIIRKQMVAIGVRQALSPVMDVARDLRWGRVGETYGEDPTHCAAFSTAFVKGLQGNDLKDGVVATGKHFIGYAVSEGGLNMTTNPITPRELREVYAKPFQAAITEANLESMMNSYGTIDGEAVITSEHILNDLLRDEMGFDGVVVSDYMSIMRTIGLKIAGNPTEGGIAALKAGLDSELPMPFGYTQELIEAVRSGDLEEKYIDRALKRMLSTKFKLGLFENPYPKPETITEAYGDKGCLEHSLKAARESIVLLKNENILPLSKDIKNIAVIGPHADSIRLLFGGYTYPAMLEMALTGGMAAMAGVMGMDMGEVPPQMPYFEGSNTVRQEDPKVIAALNHIYRGKTPTILESIKAQCTNANISYVKGCDFAGTNRNGFAEAVEAAKNADVVILTLGGKYGWGESATIGEGIDNWDIGMPGIQEEFAKAIYETGTPAVFVHMDARPLCSEFVAENFPAIIENWFPGETGGTALADVLFGDYNPSGRMPITAPRFVGQTPTYATYKNGNSYTKVGPGVMLLNYYIDGPKTPLFYFGEGKSYTEFTYSNLKVDKTVKSNGTIKVSCDITNTGKINGEEVVQVYVTDELATMVRPNKELAGFKRVEIKAGETKTVTFEMRADQFAFLDTKMNWVVEAGTMTIAVGASSEDIRLSDTFEIEDTAHISGKDRGFYAKAEVFSNEV